MKYMKAINLRTIAYFVWLIISLYTLSTANNFIIIVHKLLILNIYQDIILISLKCSSNNVQN